MLRLGIDLGGSKIEIVALDDNGHELLRRRIATPRDDYGATLQAVVNLVSDAERDLGARGTLGVGTPGAISPSTGVLRNANSTWLNGKPVLKDLVDALQREVRLENDANCFALSEARDGAGQGYRVVFGVILGTGVGAGIVVDGHLWRGPNRIAGEWGHNCLPWPDDEERPGPSCYCGRSGCIETFLSGPGMSADHWHHTGVAYGPEQICAGADAGDTDCQATLEHYQQRLARSLAHVINILDPDVIVLGGGISNRDNLYDAVTQTWGQWIFSDQVHTRLSRHRHGDSSGVRGAAWLGGAALPDDYLRRSARFKC